MEITKEEFERYVSVQKTGMYNMVMDARPAAASAGLSLEKWFEIIRNYGRLMEKYGRN